MKLLFTLDSKDYNPNGTKFFRPSARSIILKDNKVAMVHSKKYNYYKFPGGGIKENETKVDAVIRETLEEVGLNIIPESIKEFGYVHRIDKGIEADIFIQDNYYFTCNTYDSIVSQSLDEYEKDECFTLEYIEPSKAIEANRNMTSNIKNKLMIEREAKVLEILQKEFNLS